MASNLRSGPAQFLAVLALCLFLSAPVFAQSAPVAAQGFVEQVEVSLVNLDVVATDRRGQVVTDLSQSDFEVFDRGRRAEITHFSPPAPGNTPRADDPAEAEQAAREPLALVVLLDNVNTRPENRAHVLGQLRTVLLERLEPGDRALLASYDKSLRVHTSFTDKKDELLQGLAKLEASPNFGREIDADLEASMNGIAVALGSEVEGGCAQILEGVVQGYTALVTHRIQGTLAVVERLVGSLAGIPGKKALLYVSDGLEMRPGSFILQAGARRCSDFAASLRAEGSDLSQGMRRLTAVANAARVSLYPLEAASGRQARSATPIDLERRRSLSDSLTFLAEETGGKALLSAVDLPTALRPLWSDLSSSYSLAFEPPAGKAGEARDLELKCRRKGVVLRYRRSWLEPSAEARLSDRLLAALWLGESVNGLEAKLESAGPSAITPAGTYRVPVRLAVPLSLVRLEPTANEEHRGRLKVFLLTQDQSGHRSPLASAEVPVVVAAGDLEQALHQLFGFPLTLELPAGKARLALGVRDELTGELAVFTHELEVGG